MPTLSFHAPVTLARRVRQRAKSARLPLSSYLAATVERGLAFEPPTISLGALAGLPPAAVAVSDVTLSEAARLLHDRRIVPGAAASEAWLEAFGLCFTVLPVTPRIAWAAAAYAWTHRDPCDRHILATAAAHSLPLVTIDPAIAAFAATAGVRIYW